MKLALVLSLVCVAAVAAPARADDLATYQTDGFAEAAAADARTRALDVAFAAAVRRAVADLVPEAEVSRHRDDVDRQLLARARLWVASFKVITQATEGDRLHLTAAVRIDRERLRARLAELGFAVGAAPAAEPAPAAPRAATVLMRVVNPGGVMATFGAGASREIPASEAVAGVVQASGFAIADAPASGPAARADGDLPIDDGAARALAGEAHAQVAVVVSVTVAGSGRVRATRVAGALARARARVIAVDGAVLGEAAAMGGAYGTSDVPAINGALTRAAALAVTAALPGPAATAGAPPPPAAAPPLTAAPGTVLVRLRGAPTWSTVAAVRQQLSTTAGIDRVSIERLAAGEVVLAVVTKQRADRVAAATRATPDLHAHVTTDSGVVDVMATATP